MEKKPYLKMTEGGTVSNRGPVLTLEEATKELQYMMAANEGDDADSYRFTVVFMTELERENLPEFEGF